MVQANELMIGNLVNLVSLDGDVLEIEIMASDIEFCDENENDFNICYKPILITGEWLLKFGFKHALSGMEKFPLKTINRMKADSLTEYELCIGVENLWLTKIKYIHQLQNLYYALTGEELTLSVT